MARNRQLDTLSFFRMFMAAPADSTHAPPCAFVEPIFCFGVCPCSRLGRHTRVAQIASRGAGAIHLFLLASPGFGRDHGAGVGSSHNRVSRDTQAKSFEGQANCRNHPLQEFASGFNLSEMSIKQRRRRVMRRVLLLSVTALGLLVLGAHSGARAFPADPQPHSASSRSDVQLARAVVHGPRGGAAVVGPRGAAVRGPRGGAAVAGPRGAVVRGPNGGRAVVGRSYYGGVWYGPGRRYWHGRWWAYGVGSCWRNTPIGFVWICR